jgi:hypothetical protein
MRAIEIANAAAAGLPDAFLDKDQDSSAGAPRA